MEDKRLEIPSIPRNPDISQIGVVEHVYQEPAEVIDIEKYRRKPREGWLKRVFQAERELLDRKPW